MNVLENRNISFQSSTRELPLPILVLKNKIKMSTKNGIVNNMITIGEIPRIPKLKTSDTPPKTAMMMAYTSGLALFTRAIKTAPRSIAASTIPGK